MRHTNFYKFRVLSLAVLIAISLSFGVSLIIKSGSLAEAITDLIRGTDEKVCHKLRREHPELKFRCRS